MCAQVINRVWNELWHDLVEKVRMWSSVTVRTKRRQRKASPFHIGEFPVTVIYELYIRPSIWNIYEMPDVWHRIKSKQKDTFIKTNNNNNYNLKKIRINICTNLLLLIYNTIQQQDQPQKIKLHNICRWRKKNTRKKIKCNAPNCVCRYVIDVSTHWRDIVHIFWKKKKKMHRFFFANLFRTHVFETRHF